MEIEPLISAAQFTHIAETQRVITSLRKLKGSQLYDLLAAGQPPCPFDLINATTGRITHWLPLYTRYTATGDVISWEFILQFEQTVLYPEIQDYTLAVLND